MLPVQNNIFFKKAQAEKKDRTSQAQIVVLKEKKNNNKLAPVVKGNYNHNLSFYLEINLLFKP